MNYILNKIKYFFKSLSQDEISVDCLDFTKKILHTAWHPHESIIAVAATNNLFIFQDKF